MGDGMMNTTCVFCGQCVGVCPTGALKPKRESLLEEGLNPDEIFFATRGGRKKRQKKNDNPLHTTDDFEKPTRSP